MTVDHEGFETSMEQQRERARAARQDVDSYASAKRSISEINRSK